MSLSLIYPESEGSPPLSHFLMDFLFFCPANQCLRFVSLISGLGDLCKPWSCFFSSMEQENHLSILELSEAKAGEVGRCVTNEFSVFCTLDVLVLLHYCITFFGTDWPGNTTVLPGIVENVLSRIFHKCWVFVLHLAPSSGTGYHFAQVFFLNGSSLSSLELVELIVFFLIKVLCRGSAERREDIF